MADETPQAPTTTTTTPTAPPQGEPAPQAPDGYLSQDEVNRVIEQRLARERQQYEQRLREAGFSSLDEVAKLKAAQAERENAELLEQQKYKELADKIRKEKDEQLAKLNAELASTRSQYLGERAERSIIAAATKYEAVAPEQVAQLVRGAVRIDDDGNAYVVDQQGQRRTDGKGQDLTVDAYVEQFLKSNPHFQRAASGQGAGGRAGGKPADTPTLDLARARRDVDYLIEHQDEIERRIRAGELTA